MAYRRRSNFKGKSQKAIIISLLKDFQFLAEKCKTTVNSYDILLAQNYIDQINQLISKMGTAKNALIIECCGKGRSIPADIEEQIIQAQLEAVDLEI